MIQLEKKNSELAEKLNNVEKELAESKKYSDESDILLTKIVISTLGQRRKEKENKKRA